MIDSLKYFLGSIRLSWTISPERGVRDTGNHTDEIIPSTK